MSPLSVWLFYCFGANVSKSGNIVFCFWKCAARGLEATLFLMLLQCSAPWVFKALVVFFLLVHMGSGTYYNTFDFNFLSHVRMIETVDFMSKVTLLTVTKWVIARGYITEKMRGWWRGEIRPYQHVMQIGGRLCTTQGGLGKQFFNTGSVSTIYQCSLITFSVSGYRWILNGTFNSIVCYFRSSSSETHSLWHVWKTWGGTLDPGLLVAPLPELFFKPFGLCAEVLIGIADPFDAIKLGHLEAFFERGGVVRFTMESTVSVCGFLVQIGFKAIVLFDNKKFKKFILFVSDNNVNWRWLFLVFVKLWNSCSIVSEPVRIRNTSSR